MKPEESNHAAMSPEQAKQLENIHEAIFGKDFDRDQFPGILGIVTQINDDFYGNKKRNIVGVKEKTDTMWDTRIKFLGICSAAGALGVIVPAVIRLIVTKQP